MRKDLTDITIVVDRSGSMQACKNDAEGGINQFIEDQKKQTGHATLTLVQFDTVYDFVHTAKPIQDVPPYTLTPRGGTALLDAVGRAIVEAGERIGKMPEADRPGLVCFVIVTDGEENSSKEFTKDQIKEKITHQTDVYKWQFTFLGANVDAFAMGSSLGVPLAQNAQYTGDTAKQAYAAASNNVVRMRGMAARDVPVLCSYTDEERKSME